MEVIKRKISLDDYTSRKQSTWGQLTVSEFSMNVFFTQDADDMGISTGLPFIVKDGSSPDYQLLLDKLNDDFLGTTFEFMNGTTTFVPQDPLSPNTRYPSKDKFGYYINGQRVSGLTEERVDVVRSYDQSEPYKILFNLDNANCIDYLGVPFLNTTWVIDNDDENPISYIIDGSETEIVDLDDPQQNHGVLFKTYTGITRQMTSNNPLAVATGQNNGEGFGDYEIALTEMYYRGEGFNETNTTLSASTKEEYLFGITSSPEVFSDVDIDRGQTTIIQSHMQLGEITNMGELKNYGNGYYNL